MLSRLFLAAALPCEIEPLSVIRAAGVSLGRAYWLGLALTSSARSATATLGHAQAIDISPLDCNAPIILCTNSLPEIFFGSTGQRETPIFQAPLMRTSFNYRQIPPDILRFNVSIPARLIADTSKTLVVSLKKNTTIWSRAKYPAPSPIGTRPRDHRQAREAPRKDPWPCGTASLSSAAGRIEFRSERQYWANCCSLAR